MSSRRSKWDDGEEVWKDCSRNHSGRRSRSPQHNSNPVGSSQGGRSNHDCKDIKSSRNDDFERNERRRGEEEGPKSRLDRDSYQRSRIRDSRRSRSPSPSRGTRRTNNPHKSPRRIQERESESGIEDKYRNQRRSNKCDDDRNPVSRAKETLQSGSRSAERQNNFQAPINPDRPESPDSPEAENLDQPNFNQSGKLAAETNSLKGVVLKYHEPPEARRPNKKYRLYVFKGSEQIDLLHIYQQSAYLIGRDRVVVDIPIDHPSSSKQHAVIQYRQVQTKNEFGDTKTLVKPFLIDLESANGSFVNGEKVPESRYYELQQGDVIKFGFSTREFVLIPEE
ncbi:SMAD/FHA domain-containing protein [Phakopsora pachyrhizi]|uniref:SMAD/FHA domain-containing protein n=1 Tax=Phakopsora pachyrhizi TaxID=170000 RepID=A0AAV0AWZ7_PHAPC|nr:SMAD/FHA domain-containing protein [Phakopsora pachyrhizi]